MKKKALVLLLGVALLLIAGAGYVFVMGKYQASPGSWPREQFSAQSWATAPEDQRFRLYNDLAERKLLDGKSKSEIIALLGKPSFEASDGHYVTYMVKSATPGEYTLNAIYLLQIVLDRDGRVTSYYIRAD